MSERRADETGTGLPENAYRELRPGEVYHPVIPPAAAVPEATPRAIVFGLAMVVLFSAAAAYLSLKLAQGMEAAIPIAILAIGFSALLARRLTLLENVTIVALGATAGIIVGGSTFVMPAVFILGLETSFLQVFLVPLFGAVIGVLFLIPFRRYFVADMHGRLPFPEATAITEILVTGEHGGRQARVLLGSMALGFVIDFLALHLRLWRDTFTTALVPGMRFLTEQVKAVFAIGTSAAVLGLGYIIGVRYAAIICAGSFLSTLVLVPLFGRLGAVTTGVAFAGRPPLAGLGAEDIFFEYVRYIGIGTIFAAGVLSILQMSPVIVQAIGRVAGELRRMRRAARGAAADDAVPRTERDVPMPVVLASIVVVSVLLWAYFRFAVLAGVEGALPISFVALGIALLISFLFAAVSAWAVAMISITPISGMTLTTLIIATWVLATLGMQGPPGMLASLLIGGVVCTALSTTASMATILKTGYWLGATPRRIELALVGGSILASVTVTAVIFLFQSTYGYVADAAHPRALPAPQANAMAAVIQSMMASADVPWFLFGVGAVIAVTIQLMGISALAFGLGMYLPIELNTPLLVGAIVAWWVRRSPGDTALGRARENRGTLIASGFIAGGSLAGVADGAIQGIASAAGREVTWGFENAGEAGNVLGLLVFLALSIGIALASMRARREEGAGPTISM